MKTMMTASGLSLVLLASSPAAANSITFNQPFTNACYAAAAIKDTTGLVQCNSAIRSETTTAGGSRSANLVNRGILQLAADNVPAAVRDFDEALSIDPKEPEAWLGKAIGQWQTGHGADAVEMATKAIQYGPKRPAVAYLIRGLANEQQGRLRAAYSDLQTARELEPRWTEPALQLQRYRVINR